MAGRDAIGGQRLPRWPIVAVAIASALATLIASRSVAGGVTPSGCTAIDYIPVNYSIEYGAAIQSNIFVHFSPDQMFGCADCHTTSMGTQTPAGNLDLDPTDSSPYTNLVNVPSDEDPSLIYVVPNHPEKSLLFQKVNCDNPPTGVRMPFGGYGGGLSPAQQATIYDWIAGGAPIGTTDGIFRGNFDIRGFIADEIFSGDFEIP
ncbi:MAG: hypothetical protein P4L92_17110 [Rudaea sp.]|nr:hypothetical protein [Rudaea sp.]